MLRGLERWCGQQCDTFRRARPEAKLCSEPEFKLYGQFANRGKRCMHPPPHDSKGGVTSYVTPSTESHGEALYIIIQYIKAKTKLHTIPSVQPSKGSDTKSGSDSTSLQSKELLDWGWGTACAATGNVAGVDGLAHVRPLGVGNSITGAVRRSPLLKCLGGCLNRALID